MTDAQEDVDRRLREFTAHVRGYAILTLDAGGFVYTWNEGARLVKGYAAAEIIGQPYERFFCAEDVAAAHEACVRMRVARVGGSAVIAVGPRAAGLVELAAATARPAWHVVGQRRGAALVAARGLPGAPAHARHAADQSSRWRA